MFLLDDGAIVHSASDLTAAATCEYAVLRVLDAKLGRAEPVEPAADAMLARAAVLGGAHEQRVLQQLRDDLGPWDPSAGTGVVEIERPAGRLARDRFALEAAHQETLAALGAGADVVYQAGFFDGRFSGWADFLVRDREAELGAESPYYAVYDAKLARHAKIPALLQLAAYGDHLRADGVRVAPDVHLILGDRTVTSHRLDDLVPVYREREDRLLSILATHVADDAPVVWGDVRFRACGRCDVCSPEIERTRDVLLVAGLRSTQRARLHDDGIRTIDELAASAGSVAGIGAATLTSLRAQARLQVRQSPAEPAEAAPRQVEFELFAPAVVGTLPLPDPGDIFFDFEGDPLWAEPDSTVWGLEYLFGVVETPATPDAVPVFRPFWAHDRAQERQALVDFLDYVGARLAVHPDLHIYHYAPYEKSALQRLAGRHGVGEATVDDLLRRGVLVDLYATVRASLRTGQRSYSIKKLEPLYMDTARDEGGVTTAGDSIVEYADACALRDAGDLVGWEKRIEQIAVYNEYDCVSTLRLRDWLLARAAEQGVTPHATVPPDASDEGSVDAQADGDPLVDELLAFADDRSIGASGA
ncbi:MAG TPA: TM0106 family RecB-like putative nuclease [Cellulomonas sp.]|uniref:TM0106 family RecB-like putative nuclease n=1 Tax=Cellulomonas sp. TaxID=40001 RepID=UPI002E31FF4D|nr:TM0106 family RecB-like putative nuclease [Cellulomonas sp.]HEX5331761.1 TM0106 family RecB-like putative nuclease [Cellulomonas sp.]